MIVMDGDRSLDKNDSLYNQYVVEKKIDSIKTKVLDSLKNK